MYPRRRWRRYWRSRPGVARSTEAVEAERAAGEHLVLRLWGQRFDPLAEHLRRAREEPVRVRIVGGPHDLVRPDVVGEHRDAAFDRLERDPAIAPEQLTRPRLRRGLVEALVIEVPVHPVEPRRDPATARLEKRDAQSRMTVDDPAPDHAQRDQHHLHRVRDHVAGRAVVLEPVDADGRHRGGRSLVKADGEVELLGHLPERLVHRVADHLLAVIRVGPQEPAAHPELFAGMAHLVGRQLDRLHRQHRDPEEALGIRLAVIGEPAVVGAAHPGGQAGILDGAGEQAETGIEEGGIDAVRIHVDDARVRVEPAFAPLGIFQRASLDDSLPGADGPQAADPPRIAEQLAFDAQALLAVFVDDKPRPALAELGIDVRVPQVERLEDVTVRVDYVVRARHRQSLRRQSNSCNTTVAAPRALASTPFKPTSLYSCTIPIQNMVLPPTSMSYLRTKVSLPSSPMRKTDRPAGMVRIASPSLTSTGRLCWATSMRPLGSMRNVRGWMARVSMCWIGVGSPVDWSMEYAAMLFSPPLNTFLPWKSTVSWARFAPYRNRPFGCTWTVPAA